MRARDEPAGRSRFGSPEIFQGEGRHDNPDLTAAFTSPTALCPAWSNNLRASAASGSRRLCCDVADCLSDSGDRARRCRADHQLRRSVGPQQRRFAAVSVATRRRGVTQPQARQLYERHTGVAGLAWWSIYEALWMNVTLFDRAAPLMRLRSVRALKIDDPALAEAADFAVRRPWKSHFRRQSLIATPKAH